MQRNIVTGQEWSTDQTEPNDRDSEEPEQCATRHFGRRINPNLVGTTSTSSLSSAPIVLMLFRQANPLCTARHGFILGQRGSRPYQKVIGRFALLHGQR